MSSQYVTVNGQPVPVDFQLVSVKGYGQQLYYNNYLFEKKRTVNNKSYFSFIKKCGSTIHMEHNQIVFKNEVHDHTD